MRTRSLWCLLLALCTALAWALGPNETRVFASKISGAIFTTNVNDTEVNGNIYTNKGDVYLNGGPGKNAPLGAAGLPAGIYVFQVTDPSGKTLLSTDAAGCRQFTVNTAGYITDVNPSGTCGHATGLDSVTGGRTVQLMPYLDTPNSGGEYKAWATPVANYQCSLTVVDCGIKKGKNGYMHGFIPSFSKTDNFKIKQNLMVEVDTQFHDPNTGALMDGYAITHTDPLGALNVKWSEYDPSIQAYHQAHVEAIESGTHLISIDNQPGCTVGEVDLTSPGGGPIPTGVLGPQTVTVNVPNINFTQDTSWFVDVWCE